MSPLLAIAFAFAFAILLRLLVGRGEARRVEHECALVVADGADVEPLVAQQRCTVEEGLRVPIVDVDRARIVGFRLSQLALPLEAVGAIGDCSRVSRILVDRLREEVRGLLVVTALVVRDACKSRR